MAKKNTVKLPSSRAKITTNGATKGATGVAGKLLKSVTKTATQAAASVKTAAKGAVKAVTHSSAPAAKAKAGKYVYTWGDNKADGDGSMKPLLGGKGANLAEMTRIGLPVPPGYTVTTEVCTYFYANKKTYPPELDAQVEKGIANMERIMGTKFGATNAMPLLVAVRSGARDSMPGMMDT
ncbi:MAG TPA: PEP/pyruvate-binding domain-containing protein, partial [Chthoniobacteraceae bacterium]|nr:PEP/pyruvate-binding domain-containing protein [Chthoniobacteraceae bacterium]